MIFTKWYVLTGGPSSGKTKTLEYLAHLGSPTMPEAARVLIDLEMSRGRTLAQIRASEADFQAEVLRMKIRAEERIRPEQLTFFDRALPDSIAYYRVCGQPLGDLPQLVQQRSYRGVFLLERLPFEKDYARVEDDDLAQQLEEELFRTYQELGYEVVRVPIMPIAERTRFLLGHTKE